MDSGQWGGLTCAMAHPFGAAAIRDSVLDLIANTPLMRLNRLPRPGCAEVVVKLEAYNPAGSVKDRIALAMIEAAERSGELQPGATIVEPTSGNTGIGLALVAAVKGYRLIITMPADSSQERQDLLRHFGAEVILTPARKLMQGAIERAEEIVAQHPACFLPAQFRNPANPQTHRDNTAREILAACEGRVDAFVAGVGTGGTITGVGDVLKRELDSVEVVAIEPSKSPALSGGRPPEVHTIQGIGAGFVPEIVDRDVIDRVLACEEQDAFRVARELARREGISAGVSGGAAVWGALQVAAELGPEQRVVSLIPDAWERYLSVPGPKVQTGMDFVI